MLKSEILNEIWLPQKEIISSLIKDIQDISHVTNICLISTWHNFPRKRKLAIIKIKNHFQTELYHQKKICNPDKGCVYTEVLYMKRFY